MYYQMQTHTARVKRYILGIYLQCSILVTLCSIALFFSCSSVFAQSGGFSNIAYPINIQDAVPKSSIDGSIISFVDGVYRLSADEDDQNIIGISVTNPPVYYEERGASPEAYLVNSGVAYVRVTGDNGPIKNGDHITSSQSPGVGVKTITNSRVVGKALEDYRGLGIGKILVQIKPESISLGSLEQNISQNGVRSTITSATARIFDIANIFAFKDPSRAFRYILAILVAIVSLVFGFLMFGRVVLKGIEGMSRNPLAAKLIIVGVIMNIVLSLSVSGVGILLAYLIIVY